MILEHPEDHGVAASLAHEPWTDGKYVEIFGTNLAARIHAYNGRNTTPAPVSTLPRNICSGHTSTAPTVVTAKKAPALLAEALNSLVAKAVASALAAANAASTTSSTPTAPIEEQPLDVPDCDLSFEAMRNAQLHILNVRTMMFGSQV